MQVCLTAVNHKKPRTKHPARSLSHPIVSHVGIPFPSVSAVPLPDLAQRHGPIYRGCPYRLTGKGVL